MRYFLIIPAGRGERQAKNYELTQAERRTAFETIVSLKRKYANVISIDSREGMYGHMRLDIERYYEEDESFIHCRAGTRLLHIDAKGNVFPCSMFINDQEFAAGNIRQKDLIEIWQSLDTFRVFRQMRLEDLETCGTCELRKSCGGGMRCIAKFVHGDLKASDPCCAWLSESSQNGCKVITRVMEYIG